MFKSRDAYNMTNNTFLSFHDLIMKIIKCDRLIVVHTHVSIGTENKEQKCKI